MTTQDRRGHISKARYLVTRGKALGLSLTPSEADAVMALMDGHVTTSQIATAVGCAPGTIHWYFHQIYAKSGACNMAHVVLMITGVIECPIALLPVQRQWRRKYYKLDEN